MRRAYNRLFFLPLLLLFPEYVRFEVVLVVVFHQKEPSTARSHQTANTLAHTKVKRYDFLLLRPLFAFFNSCWRFNLAGVAVVVASIHAKNALEPFETRTRYYSTKYRSTLWNPASRIVSILSSIMIFPPSFFRRRRKKQNNNDVLLATTRTHSTI